MFYTQLKLRELQHTTTSLCKVQHKFLCHLCDLFATNRCPLNQKRVLRPLNQKRIVKQAMTMSLSVALSLMTSPVSFATAPGCQKGTTNKLLLENLLQTMHA